MTEIVCKWEVSFPYLSPKIATNNRTDLSPEQAIKVIPGPVRTDVE